MRARIERLRAGQFGLTKALKDGLFELKFQSPAFRIYYALDGRDILLLICAGDKSSQLSDIERAKEYLTEYWRRHEKK